MRRRGTHAPGPRSSSCHRRYYPGGGLRRLPPPGCRQASQARRRTRRRAVPDRDRVGPNLGHALQRPEHGGLRPGRGRAGRLHLRSDRPRRLLGRLPRFEVRISTALLAAGLISEILILLIFDGFLFARGHVTASPLNLVNAFKGFPAQGRLAAGAIGIGLFFAFWSWVGFETAPNYGEESRDPKRIIPRALSISVIGLGIFYAMTSWASLAGYPSTHAAIAASQTNAASYFLTPATRYAGHWVSSVMSYLIITGSFACGMAFHNTTARYLYSLGREGLAPKALGRTHPKWKSPHIASVTQSVIAAVTRRRGALVEDPASPADLVLLPGLRGVPAVHQHLVPRRRVQLRELAGTD